MANRRTFAYSWEEVREADDLLASMPFSTRYLHEVYPDFVYRRLRAYPSAFWQAIRYPRPRRLIRLARYMVRVARRIVGGDYEGIRQAH